MAHSSRSSCNASSGSASVSSGETAGSSGDGAAEQMVITPQPPGGSGSEISYTAIRMAVLAVLADPEVIRQFGTTLAAASSVPSTLGGTMEVVLGPGTDLGGATA